MREIIRTIRKRFHPLFYACKYAIGRFAIRILDRPAWLSVECVKFPVRGRIVTHGLAFGITGSQEKTSEAWRSCYGKRLPRQAKSCFSRVRKRLAITRIKNPMPFAIAIHS